jgi:hypothetical protein
MRPNPSAAFSHLHITLLLCFFSFSNFPLSSSLCFVLTVNCCNKIVVYFQEEMEINLHGKIYSKYLNFPSCSSTGTQLIIKVFDRKQQHSNLYMCFLVFLSYTEASTEIKFYFKF